MIRPHTGSTALAILALIMLMCGACIQTRSPLLTGNHMAIADGEPVFLLGLYENPVEDVHLQQAVDAGFNLIRSRPDREALDRLEKHGAKAWINLGHNLDLSQKREAREKALLDLVHAHRDHPALLVWEGPDELLWNCWYGATTYFGNQELPRMSQIVSELGKDDAEKREKLRALARHCQDLFGRGLWASFDEAREEFWAAAGQAPPQPEVTMVGAAERAWETGDGLTAGFQAVREADPDHILWLNHAPRNSIAAMRHHNRAVDLAGCDIYPVPGLPHVGHSDLQVQGVTAVGAYTRRMADAAPGKGVAMVLQGFGWADINEAFVEQEKRTQLGVIRRPNWHETRFMAYDAIVNGANAILYWGTNYIEKDSQFWKDLLRLARELTPLQPALVAPSVTPGPLAVAADGYGSVDEGGPRLMLKEVDQEYVLIAVNEHLSPVAFTVRDLPRNLEGKNLYRLGTDESQIITGRGFRDGMGRESVHVYATSRRFESRQN